MSSRPGAADCDIDVTAFCMRLRDRLAQLGYPRPVPAAVALALRGRDGTDVEQFAAAHGLSVELVQRIEAGLVGLADVPGELLDRADHELALDWGRLLGYS